jgi:hypothetical protein
LKNLPKLLFNITPEVRIEGGKGLIEEQSFRLDD